MCSGSGVLVSQRFDKEWYGRVADRNQLKSQSADVICDGRPPVPYDLLSINIGSTPSLGAVPGAAGVVVPVKPIRTFVDRWERLRARVASAGGSVRIGVVGAGAGGVEIMLAVQHSLRQMLEELGRAEVPEFHLFGANDTILATHNRGMRRRLERVLRERSVRVHLGQAVTSVADGVAIAL